MTRKEIEEKVLQIVSVKADIPAQNLKLASSFKQDMGFDSLAIMDLVLACEDTFHMTIPDEEAEKLKNIGDAINYITRQLQA